jgi:hypothetical protein
MKAWIGAALAGAVVLGGCQTTADFAAGGAGTRTTVKPPDTTRWASRKADERTIVYICRPLACPEKAGVRVRTGRSPTRTPDPAALEKLARETLPSRVEAASLTLETESKGYTKLDVLGTKTTTIRDFPAVTVDVRKTGEGRPCSAGACTSLPATRSSTSTPCRTRASWRTATPTSSSPASTSTTARRVRDPRGGTS